MVAMLRGRVKPKLMLMCGLLRRAKDHGRLERERERESIVQKMMPVAVAVVVAVVVVAGVVVVVLVDFFFFFLRSSWR